MAGTSTQDPDSGAVGDNISQHQARLRAAAFAASLYEKSFAPTDTIW